MSSRRRGLLARRAACHTSHTSDVPPPASGSTPRSPPSAPHPGSVAPAVGSSVHPPPLRSLPTLLSGALFAIASSPARLVVLRSPAAFGDFVPVCSSWLSCPRLPLTWSFSCILPPPSFVQNNEPHPQAPMLFEPIEGKTQFTKSEM